MDEMLKEAKRLYDLGLAIHWLRPKSKMPLESGWGSGPRRDWEYLNKTFQPSYNLGVRTGSPSKIGERGCLAVIDVDVKSLDPRHKKEALNAARALLCGHACPVVTSGRGNGSRHYYAITAKPFKTFNPAVSSETVKVHMPSKTRISKRERAELTEVELNQGVRLAHAWEVSLYSDGRQVVLPPSLHPDSGRVYEWRSPCPDWDAIPTLVFELPKESEHEAGTRDRGAQETIEDFEITGVNLDWLDVPKSVSNLIKTGLWKGSIVSNRSDYLLVATTGLVSAGCSRDDILTVLTERDYFLGEVAYEHTDSGSRKRAAQWLWNYTVKKVMAERDGRQAFIDAGTATPVLLLTPIESATQKAEIEADTSWKQGLERTKDGAVRATLNNCKLILTTVCSVKGIVGRNEFAANDFYLCNTPWKSKKGDAVTDVDIHRIKFYCAEQVGVELPDNLINQTLMEIADDNRFHPVRNWLGSLKWDGTKRLDTWLIDHAGATGPDAYLRAVARKVLVAMVKRVYEPGCKFDFVLILEGLQGLGKSTLLRKLASDAWFSDAALVIGDKDAVLTMQSKWLIELGELSSMRRTETEQLKAFITQTTDRIRAPYGKRVEEFPRQCIFIGSTNNEEYLPDLTGNRRFWPVKVTSIEFDGIAGVREQLFAEALLAYRAGEALWLDDTGVAALAVGEQAKRQQSDEWIGQVGDAIHGELFPFKAFEIRDVAKRMGLDFGRMSPYDTQRIARCLIQLDCVSYREPRRPETALGAKRCRPAPQRRPAADSDATKEGICPENDDFY